MKKSTEAAKTMTDSNGTAVPAQYVKPWDKLRNKVTRRIEARWAKARRQLEAVMAETVADIDTLMEARTKETGAPVADRGNFRVSSFDGLIHVDMRQSYRIVLDDRVREARRIMLAWAAGLVGSIEQREPRALMLQLIEEAFSASSTGTLPVGKILSLLRRDIKAPEWQRAKKLLEDAIQPEKGKCYVAVLVRPDRQHEPERIKLDVSDCWPAATGKAVEE